MKKCQPDCLADCRTTFVDIEEDGAVNVMPCKYKPGLKFDSIHYDGELMKDIDKWAVTIDGKRKGIIVDGGLSKMVLHELIELDESF